MSKVVMHDLFETRDTEERRKEEILDGIRNAVATMPRGSTIQVYRHEDVGFYTYTVTFDTKAFTKNLDRKIRWAKFWDWVRFWR